MFKLKNVHTQSCSNLKIVQILNNIFKFFRNYKYVTFFKFKFFGYFQKNIKNIKKIRKFSFLQIVLETYYFGIINISKNKDKIQEKKNKKVFLVGRRHASFDQVDGEEPPLHGE
jgi:hypothetical protein